MDMKSNKTMMLTNKEEKINEDMQDIWSDEETSDGHNTHTHTTYKTKSFSALIFNDFKLIKQLSGEGSLNILDHYQMASRCVTITNS